MPDKSTTLVAVAVLGIGAQWLAWRLNLPAILLLLLFGLAAGVSGLLDPNALLGDLLQPCVSLSVALILYEGGLSLRLKELAAVGKVVRNLATFGAAITWLGAGVSAHFLFGLSPLMAALVGAIFIVTGPTVVGPLLRHVRPTGSVGPILKWEGIVTDPVGAMLAVLLFEIISAGHQQQAPLFTLVGTLKTVAAGGAVGAFGAWLLWSILKRHLVADYLQNSISLMLVLMVFAAGNLVQGEAGLFGVTLMGVLLANQRSAPVGHIIEFKENLRVLLISGLFILLAARLEVGLLETLGWRHFAYLALLILVIRPLTVFASTAGSKLSLNEKLFLCCVAPRGIVAAAVASVLGLELAAKGYAEAELLVPLTFLVIIGTVTCYGLSAAPVARWLGLSAASRKGTLILGAHTWARAMAQALQQAGCRVQLVDTNRRHVMQARVEGLSVYHGNLLAEQTLDEVDLSGVGRLLAVTSNDEVNALACQHFEELFGRADVYQLVVDEEEGKEMPTHMGGRHLFGEGISYHTLELLRRQAAEFRAIAIDAEFKLAEFVEEHREAVPLFCVTEAGIVRVFTIGEKTPLAAGDQLICMMVPTETGGREPAPLALSV